MWSAKWRRFCLGPNVLMIWTQIRVCDKMDIAYNNLSMTIPDSKIHRANMGPTWGLQKPWKFPTIDCFNTESTSAKTVLMLKYLERNAMFKYIDQW